MQFCVCYRFAVDLVVCVALGCDMFDCVFPTRTAVSDTLLGPISRTDFKSLSSCHLDLGPQNRLMYVTGSGPKLVMLNISDVIKSRYFGASRFDLWHLLHVHTTEAKHKIGLTLVVADNKKYSASKLIFYLCLRNLHWCLCLSSCVVTYLRTLG